MYRPDRAAQPMPSPLAPTHLCKLALAAAVNCVQVATLQTEGAGGAGRGRAGGGVSDRDAMFRGGLVAQPSASRSQPASQLASQAGRQASRATSSHPPTLPPTPSPAHLGGQPQLVVGSVSHVLQPPRGGAVVGLPVALACSARAVAGQGGVRRECGMPKRAGIHAAQSNAAAQQWHLAVAACFGVLAPRHDCQLSMTASPPLLTWRPGHEEVSAGGDGHVVAVWVA